MTDAVRKFRGFVFGRVDEFADDFDGRLLAGAGGHRRSGHQVGALFLGEAAHDHLDLAVREQTGESHDAGSHAGRLGGAVRIVEDRVDAVAVDRLVTAAVTVGDDVGELRSESAGMPSTEVPSTGLMKSSPVRPAWLPMVPPLPKTVLPIGRRD